MTYLRIKDLRVPSLHLIMVLSVADFFFALKYCLTGGLVLSDKFNVQDDWYFSIEAMRPADFPPVTSGCVGSAFLQQFFGLASVSWNAVLALNMALNLRDPMRMQEPVSYC